MDNLIKTLKDYINEHFIDFTVGFIIGSLVFLVCMKLSKIIVKKVKEKIENQSITKDEYTIKMSNMIGSVIYTILIIFIIFLVLAIWGFNVGIIIGALSISIGFALEDTIKNIVSGILILTHKKLKIGDFVKILGKIDTIGKIEEITIRYTIVRRIDKRRVIIPNSELISTPVQTIKSEPIIRGDFLLKMPRYINTQQVKNLLISTINSHTHVINKEQTISFISGFDSHGVEFTNYFYLSPQMGKSAFIICGELRILLSKLLKKYGIKAPYENIVINVE